MSKNSDQTPEQKATAQLQALFDAGQKLYEGLERDFPGISQQLNPDGTLLQEFIKYLQDIGIITELQVIQFQIEHTERVVELFKRVRVDVEKQQKQAMAKQLFVPPQAGSQGLIVPGR